MNFIFLTILLQFFIETKITIAQPATVVTYPQPAGIMQAPDYSIEVNGKPLFVYEVPVGLPPFDKYELTPFAYFDFSGKVIVKIKTTIKVDRVDIRPRSYGIEAVVKDNTISFELSQPRKLSIEINGTVHRALQLFSNPIELNPPKVDDPDVVYFGPGVHNAGVIRLESNKTVYLAGGAYVFGTIEGSGINNVAVAGRGILCCSKSPLHSKNGISIRNCSGLKLYDFIMLDPSSWMIRIDGCKNVSVDNIKIIGSRNNSDGIDVCSSQDLTVNDSYIRSWDDGLVIKGSNSGDVTNLSYKNIILWTDFGRPLEIGAETRADLMSDIHFKDIDIIHSLSGYPSLAIHNGDRAVVKNVRFENIRIEDAPGSQLLELRVYKSDWNKDTIRGYIRDIYFKNIFLNGKPGVDFQPENSRIEGYNQGHMTENITFENVRIMGKVITNAADGNINVKSWTRNITFVPPSELTLEEKVIPVESSLEIIKPFSPATGVSQGTVRLSIKNISTDSQAKGRIWLDITPDSDIKYLKKNEFSFTLKPGESISREIPVELPPGKYFFTSQSDYVGLRRSWKLVAVDLKLPRLAPLSSLDKISGLLEKFPVLEIRGNNQNPGKLRLAVAGKYLVVDARIIDNDPFSNSPLTVTANDENKMGQLKKVNLHGLFNSIPANNFSGQILAAVSKEDAHGLFNSPWQSSAVEFFGAMPVSVKNSEALFILPETATGRTTALRQGLSGPELAPDMRNIWEILFVYKNQPSVKRIGHVILQPDKKEDAAVVLKKGSSGPENAPEVMSKVIRDENGYTMLALIPLTLVAVEDNADTFLMEIMITAKSKGTSQIKPLTLFHSMRPWDNSCMFVRCIVDK